MEPFLVAGRTSSSGHAHIPEARLDHRLRPAELMFRADAKEERGNKKTVRGEMSLPSTSVSHRNSLLTLADVCLFLFPSSPGKVDVMSLGISEKCWERSTYTWQKKTKQNIKIQILAGVYWSSFNECFVFAKTFKLLDVFLHGGFSFVFVFSSSVEPVMEKKSVHVYTLLFCTNIQTLPFQYRVWFICVK